jgi:hypothetical protein
MSSGGTSKTQPLRLGDASRSVLASLGGPDSHCSVCSPARSMRRRLYNVHGAIRQIGKAVKRTHQSFLAASSRRTRRPFGDKSADLDHSMYVNQSAASEARSSCEFSDEHEAPSHRPEYGYAGNRSFTPEARFTGVMEFLTKAPAEAHASYIASRLGTLCNWDLIPPPQMQRGGRDSLSWSWRVTADGDVCDCL